MRDSDIAESKLSTGNSIEKDYYESGTELQSWCENDTQRRLKQEKCALKGSDEAKAAVILTRMLAHQHRGHPGPFSLALPVTAGQAKKIHKLEKDIADGKIPAADRSERIKKIMKGNGLIKELYKQLKNNSDCATLEGLVQITPLSTEGKVVSEPLENDFEALFYELGKGTCVLEFTNMFVGGRSKKYYYLEAAMKLAAGAKLELLDEQRLTRPVRPSPFAFSVNQKSLLKERLQAAYIRGKISTMTIAQARDCLLEMASNFGERAGSEQSDTAWRNLQEISERLRTTAEDFLVPKERDADLLSADHTLMQAFLETIRKVDIDRLAVAAPRQSVGAPRGAGSFFKLKPVRHAQALDCEQGLRLTRLSLLMENMESMLQSGSPNEEKLRSHYNALLVLQHRVEDEEPSNELSTTFERIMNRAQKTLDEEKKCSAREEECALFSPEYFVSSVAMM